MIERILSGYRFIFGSVPVNTYSAIAIVVGLIYFQNIRTYISENSVHIVHSKDGTIIVSQRSGSGPPLVLVHGGTADYTRWRPVLPQLEQMFTVYAVDRRGRGRSIDTGEYNIQREFEDIAAAHTILREVRALEDSPPFDPERFKNITIPTLLLLGGDSPAEYGDFVRRIDKTLPKT